MAKYKSLTDKRILGKIQRKNKTKGYFVDKYGNIREFTLKPFRKRKSNDAFTYWYRGRWHRKKI